MKKILPTTRTAAACFLMGAALVGCSGSTVAESEGPLARGQATRVHDGGSRASIAVDGKALANFFRFVRYRFEVLPETEDLAKISITDTAVKGTVAGFSSGPRLYEDGGESSGATMIMSVTIIQRITGGDHDIEKVDVLLPASGKQEPRDFKAALPIGAEVVVYLSHADDLPNSESQALMTPVSPQGFVVSAGEGNGIVYPLMHEVNEDESLDEQLP